MLKYNNPLCQNYVLAEKEKSFYLKCVSSLWYANRIFTDEFSLISFASSCSWDYILAIKRKYNLSVIRKKKWAESEQNGGISISILSIIYFSSVKDHFTCNKPRVGHLLEYRGNLLSKMYYEWGTQSLRIWEKNNGNRQSTFWGSWALLSLIFTS